MGWSFLGEGGRDGRGPFLGKGGGDSPFLGEWRLVLVLVLFYLVIVGGPL